MQEDTKDLKSKDGRDEQQGPKRGKRFLGDSSGNVFFPDRRDQAQQSEESSKETRTGR